MKQIWMVVVVAMVLGGCTGPALDMAANGSFYNLESKSTGAIESSLKTLITFMCVKDTDNYEEITVNGNTAKCDGRFVILDRNQANQTGYMTGVMSSAIQGGAFVGGMYLLGNGIGDSGSRTTNNNNTASQGGNSSSLGVGGQGGSATSASQGGAGGNGYGFGGSSSSKSFSNATSSSSSSSGGMMPRHGRD